MKLRWTRRAKDDLVDIGRFIARDKREAARRWVRALRQQARKAAELPGVGRKVPELMRDDIREVVFHGYRIVYKVQDDTVFVLTVFQGRRRLPRDLADEPEP